MIASEATPNTLSPSGVAVLVKASASLRTGRISPDGIEIPKWEEFTFSDPLIRGEEVTNLLI